jgi:hypothetical protein
MKPRVRLIHDKQQAPEEVRVIIAPPTSHTKTFDEFNGLVKVEADDCTKQVQSISLDCKKLGGKQYEDALFELLAWVKMSEARKGIRRFNFPGPVRRAMAKCQKLCTDDRIDLTIERIKVDQQRKWGPLHPLLNATFENNGDANHPSWAALKDYIGKLGENWLGVTIELIITCVEDYRQNGVGGNVMRLALEELDQERLLALVQEMAKKPLDVTYWRLMLDIVFDTNQAAPQKFNVCKGVYYGMLNAEGDKETIDPENRNRYVALEYSESPAIVILEDELGNEADIRSFYQDVIANDPDEAMVGLAKGILQGFDEEDKQDDHAEHDDHADHYPVGLADIPIADAPVQQLPIPVPNVGHIQEDNHDP